MTESWKLTDAKWLRQQYDRLTAERDALKAELEQLKEMWRNLQAVNADLRADNERLRAEVAANADVIRVCEALLTENRSEAELLEELRELREAVEAACRKFPFDTDPDSPWGRLEAVLAKVKP